MRRTSTPPRVRRPASASNSLSTPTGRPAFADLTLRSAICCRVAKPRCAALILAASLILAALRNARTALFNYLFAKHYDGDFVVRIEDTDSKRNLEDGESSQFDNLKWLGLDWDESIDKAMS